MEAASSSQSSRRIATDCHNTALCLIPPQHLWPSIERLRCQYDKAFERWPPHVNIVYPFVPIHDLPAAIDMIVARLEARSSQHGSQVLDINLDAASYFQHKRSNTLYIHDPNPDRTSALVQLRSLILGALGHAEAGSYTMHMSVGQTLDIESDAHKFLMEKVALLPAMAWGAEHLVVLKMDGGHDSPTMMQFWGAIDLRQIRLTRDASPVGLYDNRVSVQGADREAITPSRTYTYSLPDQSWTPVSLEPSPPMDVPEALVIATYNVLAEFTSPPSQARYALLVNNILDTIAAVIVLQEVTDDFLTYLLADDRVRGQYAFVTHGPPDQHDLDPLASFLNQVVLSKFPFTWGILPLKRRHKTSLVVTFPSIGKSQADAFHPLILATCHLTRGLTDGAVSAKKGELRRIVDHLERNHNNSPWILAGDFNLTTSQYTIDSALEKRSITQHTVDQIHSIEELLSSHGLLDTWVVARTEVGESSDDLRRPKHVWEVYEGEQGATFDPTENRLAAELVGSGLGNRPQRYDRILVKPDDMFRVAGFSMFGFSTTEAPYSSSDVLPGSDHWGVRCLLRTGDKISRVDSVSNAVPLILEKAPERLGNSAELKECLQSVGGFPTEEDEEARTGAFETLRNAIIGALQPRGTHENGNQRQRPALVVTPVGSFALGVWSHDSDVDCLCIGPFSSRTFFSVVTRYLRLADGITVLRKVNASTGVMLELEVGGVRMDLQYCAAALIAESWPDAMKRPTTDPIFALPSRTLSKLKAARDIAYLRRSIPDLAQFRLAYLLIKTWAKEKGIYAAKFGYLGGIHILVMLVPVCKILGQRGSSVSVSDIIVTFFRHYARFDWKEHTVFDPFFHKCLRYVRTSREPLCLLGWHGPSLNTALTASAPTVKTIAAQFQAADEFLGRDGVTWPMFIGFPDHRATGERPMAGVSGASLFLQTFRSYVRLDVHYWGLSRERRNGLVGWLGSRCVSVLVDIDRQVPELVTRIWPKTFVEAESSESDGGNDAEYRGCFLIGLEWREDRCDTRAKSVMEAAKGSLVGVLRRFEDRIRSDERYYDPKTAWIAATIVPRGELGSLELDPNEWGDLGTLGDGSDSDLDDDDDDVESDEEHPAEDSVSHNHRAGHARPTKQPGAGKLRPAADVMNRLRWDDGIDSSDYLVGYEDRFVGIVEKDLGDWKSEQTDEEFIPQHRIAYFKRRSDGVLVWDRAARVDLIFGSG